MSLELLFLRNRNAVTLGVLLRIVLEGCRTPTTAEEITATFIVGEHLAFGSVCDLDDFVLHNRAVNGLLEIDLGRTSEG